MAPPLLSLRDVGLMLGEQVLFADLGVTISKGDRICLVGRNGAGKSTLLKVLAGLMEPDRGERFLQPRTRAAYLPQMPDLPLDATVLDAVLHDPAGLDGGRDGHQAERMLAAFAIDPAAIVGRLSGGQARRVALARTLLGEPDILLLDEPTNHLDIAAIEQLERDLKLYRGALVMISHDRRFLEELSSTTWWLDRGRLRVLEQGFAYFDAWSAEELAREEAEVAKLAKSIDAETDWLHFGVTARRKRNMGRLRRLQAMRAERAARLPEEGRVRLETTSAPPGGRLAIEADDVCFAFDQKTIIKGFSSRVLRGDRIGIIGSNGAGKTTLIKLLTGSLAPDRGTVRLGTNLKIAMIDQRRESLDLDATPWSVLCPDGGDQLQVQGRWRHVAGYLRDFLFRPSQYRTPVRALSGGERNRLLLARQLAQPANLLVLDEPTNDLDMDTLDLLQDVLFDFDGTLLLVSHDRDFLDRLVTSTIVLDGRGGANEYAGGYSDYLRQRPEPEEAPPAKPAPKVGRLKTSRTAATRQVQRDLDRLEKKLTALQTEKALLESHLGDPDLYRRDPGQFDIASHRLEAVRHDIEIAEENWLVLQIELEDLEKT